MDAVRTRLVELAAARGTSLASLSAMIGRNVAYLGQFVGRGTPRALAERDRRTLAAFFGVDEADLGGGTAPPRPFRVPRLDVAASAGPGSLVDAEVAVGTDMLDASLARRLGLRAGAAAVIRARGIRWSRDWPTVITCWSTPPGERPTCAAGCSWCGSMAR